MLAPTQWMDNPELFEAVYEALESGDGFTTTAREERSEYGERGTITIKTPDGRRFRLSISEEH